MLGLDHSVAGDAQNVHLGLVWIIWARSDEQDVVVAFIGDDGVCSECREAG